MTKDKKVLHKASEGKQCPFCLTVTTSAIKWVGSNFDGIRMNNAFDCKSCGGQWEGY